MKPLDSTSCGKTRSKGPAQHLNILGDWGTICRRQCGEVIGTCLRICTPFRATAFQSKVKYC